MYVGSSSSGNYTSSTSLYSNRISGLASGIDTETMINNLTAPTRSRIASVTQQKQLIEWKQDDYRSIISKLLEFKDKYFDILSSSNTLSKNFYYAKTVSYLDPTSSKYINISANSDAVNGKITVSNIQLATSASVTSSNCVSKSPTISIDSGSLPVDLTGKALNITVAGVTKTITFSSAFNSAADFALELQLKLDVAFGAERLKVDISANQVTINSDGSQVTLDSGSDIFSAAGVVLDYDRTNRVDLAKSLADNAFATELSGDTFEFEINGKTFSFTKDTSVSTIISTINASGAGVKISYSSITDKFTIVSTATGELSAVDMSDTAGNLLSVLFGAGEVTKGKDASLYINGQKVVRSSNTFIIDGVTYNLLSDTAGSIDINIAPDIDATVNLIKDFVDSYNKVLDAINGKLREERYRDYLPLTAEQRKELSQDEITLWENKARSGLLRNDTALENVVSSMRSALYTDVKDLSDNSLSIGISLADIGIATGAYTDRGKLTINEDKLRQALLNNPDAVYRLFAQKSDKAYSTDPSDSNRGERYAESGLMWRLADILEDNVRKTSGGGILLKIAGMKGTSTEYNNSLYSKISNYNKNINKLQDMLAMEEERLWKQFSLMEEAIAKLNNQSNWLSQQFSQ